MREIVLPSGEQLAVTATPTDNGFVLAVDGLGFPCVVEGAWETEEEAFEYLWVLLGDLRHNVRSLRNIVLPERVVEENANPEE